MRFAWAVLVTAVISGCTTPASVSGNAAFWSGSSTARPHDVAACIAVAWSATKGFHVHTDENPDATSVMLSGSSVTGIDMIATISRTGSVEMHKRPALWSDLDKKLRDNVIACAAHPAPK